MSDDRAHQHLRPEDPDLTSRRTKPGCESRNPTACSLGKCDVEAIEEALRSSIPWHLRFLADDICQDALTALVGLDRDQPIGSMVAMARGITRKMCASTTRHIMRDKRAAYDIKHLHEAGAFTSNTHDNASELERVGSARAVTGPGFPRIRTCGIPASGSSWRSLTGDASPSVSRSRTARDGGRRRRTTIPRTDELRLSGASATFAKA